MTCQSDEILGISMENFPWVSSTYGLGFHHGDMDVILIADTVEGFTQELHNRQDLRNGVSTRPQAKCYHLEVVAETSVDHGGRRLKCIGALKGKTCSWEKQ